jgi:prephenate dehydrogenase
VQFQQVTLAGVGLLGGSLGLALKQHGLARSITGLVRRPDSITECLRLGIVDHATLNPLEAASNADLIVLATPIAHLQPVLVSMLPAIRPGTLITDVASVKAPIVRALEPLANQARAQFVGSHPMAGSEAAGAAAARPNLFVNTVCVITPTPVTPPPAQTQIESLWLHLGVSLLHLRPDTHDDLVGRSSHLPHIVAAQLAHYILSPAHPPEQQHLCASGFRDTTRVAASPAEIWRDIALANRDNILRVLGVFIEGLDEFRHTLETRDDQALLEFFASARKRRNAWSTNHKPATHHPNHASPKP